MTFENILQEVTSICRKHHVQHLYLFGSYAAGDQTPSSDIDFVVKGCEDFDKLEDEIQNIMTLKKIDLFDYDHIRNPNLKEDMDLYGKKIY